jgi:hypothetical protein
VSVITFYQSHEGVGLLVDPPKPASKSLPEWYRKQSAPLGEFGSTIKRCMPIFDIMTAGYILELPCDIYIDATNPDKLSYAVPQGVLDNLQQDLFAEHLPQQMSDYPKDLTRFHKDVLRIDPFYTVGTEKGYSSLMVQPFHADSTPLHAFGAMIDTDTYISSGHYSFYVEKDFKGIIKQGTPLIQVIPIKRDSFKSKVVLFEKAEIAIKKQSTRLLSTFTGGYKNKFRTKKDYK